MNNIIEEFLTSRLISNCRPSTLRSYTRTMNSLANYMGQSATASDLTPTLVKNYMGERAKSLRATSLNGIRRVLIAFLHWCESEGLIQVQNWGKRLPKIKEDSADPRHLTAEECARLLSAVEIRRRGNPLLAARDRAMLCLLMDTGLRRAEICALRLPDADPVAQSVTVRISKSRKSRTVYFGDTTSQAVKHYLRARKAYLHKLKRDVDHLWITRTCGQLSCQELYDTVKKLAKLSRMPHLGVHSLRHTCATLLLRNGYPLPYVQAQLGHSSPIITQRYLHMSSDDLHDKYQGMSPVDNL